MNHNPTTKTSVSFIAVKRSVEWETELMEIHLNSKISRQLIKCRSAWLAWTRWGRSQSFSPSLHERLYPLWRGQENKSYPTGRPDKPDQKEHTEGRGASSGLHEEWESKNREFNNHPSSPPLVAPKHSHRRGARTKTHLVNSIVEIGTATAPCALVLSGWRLHLSSCPALSASQRLWLCPGCQGCGRQGSSGGLTVAG